MDNTPELTKRQYKQLSQMVMYLNSGFNMHESIFPNLYLFKHTEYAVDKVLLIDKQTMDFYYYFYE